MTCDHSFDKSIRIALTADPNREYEISAGIPATDIDTTPANIKGGFGKCGNKDVDCVPEFLPKWFTTSNSAYFQDVRSVTISELKSFPTQGKSKLIIRYLHLQMDSNCTIKVGDILQVGQKIGYVGHTGRSSWAHLHMDINYNGEINSILSKPDVTVDPTQFWDFLPK